MDVNEVKSKLPQLLVEINRTHKPIVIKDGNNGAVLISEEDWRSVEETLYLLSVPGMRESLVNGMKEEPNSLDTEPGW